MNDWHNFEGQISHKIVLFIRIRYIATSRNLPNSNDTLLVGPITSLALGQSLNRC